MLNILHNNRCVSPNKLSCIHTGLYKTVSFVARAWGKTDLNTEIFCWIIVSAANRKTLSILPHKTLPNDRLWQPCDVLSPVFQLEWKTCIKAFAMVCTVKNAYKYKTGTEKQTQEEMPFDSTQQTVPSAPSSSQEYSCYSLGQITNQHLQSPLQCWPSVPSLMLYTCSAAATELHRSTPPPPTP